MKKSISMSLMVFLALALVGFAYAAWSDSLSITGAVSAAELGVKFLYDRYTEEATYADQVDVTVVPDDEGKTLTVTVANAVPEYWVDIHYEFQNVGELPIVIREVTVEEGHAPWLTIDTAGAGEGATIAQTSTSNEGYKVRLACGDGVSGTTQFTIEFTAELSTGQ